VDKEHREEKKQDDPRTDDNPSVKDTETLKGELAEAKARAEANLAGWQRAQADFTNYRKRGDQEKSETIKSANAELITRLLPVLDDIDRALVDIPADIAKSPWVRGVKLIEENILKILEGQGLKTIECAGEKFDPACHEALMTCKGQEGRIMQQVLKGYIYNNRLLRPARVIVGCGEGDEASTKKEA
jgi:molecular chaperone GrpE